MSGDEEDDDSANASVLHVEVVDDVQLEVDPLDASLTYTFVGTGNHVSLCVPSELADPFTFTLYVLPVSENE